MQLSQQEVDALARKKAALQGQLDAVSASITTPTWGYHPVEADRIFNLGPGEKLPEGWSDAPVEKVNPAPTVAEVSAAELDARSADLDKAMAEIEARAKALTDLSADLEARAAKVAAAESQLAGALAEIEARKGALDTRELALLEAEEAKKAANGEPTPATKPKK